MLKNTIKNTIADNIRSNVTNQNPIRKGLSIDITDVISIRFLNCLTALTVSLCILVA